MLFRSIVPLANATGLDDFRHTLLVLTRSIESLDMLVMIMSLRAAIIGLARVAYIIFYLRYIIDYDSS